MARHVAGADVVVAGMGPGVVGTGTTLGTTAVEAAAIVDAAAGLGGCPVLCARVSAGDERSRHQGLSHHTRTVMDLIRTPGVPDPVAGGGPGRARCRRRSSTASVPPDHHHGPGPEDDPAFFAARGRHSAAAEACRSADRLR